MIKQIFTWWNSQTLGTFLYTIVFGKLIGKDEFGNKYYQNKNGKNLTTENHLPNSVQLPTCKSKIRLY